jgi:hypothetical protein
MARSKPSVDDSVSLFPFLSILACIIGILVLMITAITLGQIGQDKASAADAADEAKLAQAEAEAKARVEAYKQLRNALQTDEQQARRLQALLLDAATVRENLAAARAELQALEAKQTDAQKKLQLAKLDQAKKLADAARLKAEIDALTKRLPSLLEQIKRLKAELAKRKAPPEEAQVRVLPSGSGTNLNATFVECAAASLVLHDTPKGLRVPIAQAGASKEFAALLNQVKTQKGGTVVFLVRPDGVGTYNSARSIARSRGVLNGKLAIAGQGKLDLSLFKGKP